MKDIPTPTLLIVDDSRALRITLRGALEQLGFTIHEAASGEEALDFLTHFIPEAVLLDVTMDGIGGFATCQKIRENVLTKYLPIMMVTSLDDINSINKAFQCGATDFITKPINFDLIGHRVRYMVRASYDFVELQKSKEEIYQLNAELEERVVQRTEQLKSANDELKTTLLELQSTQRQLIESEKLASLGGMVAGIAHEVNTPIGISVTAVSILKEKLVQVKKSLSQNQLRRSELNEFFSLNDETLHLLNTNLQRAVELIKSFKQVSADQVSEDRRVFNLKEYLSEAILSLKPALKKTRLQTLINCPNDLLVDTYPGILFQVVTILVMNSIVHGFDPDQAGTLSIDASLLEGQVTIRYKDTGKGIPPENIKKIFDPFFTTRRGTGGIGLGLNLIYNRITQNMGGTIACESKLGEGVVFTITFPKEFILKEA